jgi:hypothetical protein
VGRVVCVRSHGGRRSGSHVSAYAGFRRRVVRYVLRSVCCRHAHSGYFAAQKRRTAFARRPAPAALSADERTTVPRFPDMGSGARAPMK